MIEILLVELRITLLRHRRRKHQTLRRSERSQ